MNQQLEFEEVRWRISRDVSPDFQLSFEGTPEKVLLKCQDRLFRLVPYVNGFEFEGVWWMPQAVFDDLRTQTNQASHGDGRLLRHYIAQSLALKLGSFQLCVVEIELVQPVYVWSGIAAKLFNKPGGKPQYYLPNLADKNNSRHSLYAKMNRSYWLKFGKF